MTSTLYGYKYSVYNRIARICLTEKNVSYETCEINPFDPTPDPAYCELHPFFKVPVLVDGDFKIYETTAITRYIDEKYSGSNLQPKDPANIARMTQLNPTRWSKGVINCNPVGSVTLNPDREIQLPIKKAS